MGGLVARSACNVGASRRWMSLLTKLVCGTARTPGQARSAGITDLRSGNVQDADWQHRDRHAQKRDDRVPTPLPEGVRCCFVAATTAETATGLRSATVGDGLVPLASALGRHRNPRLALRVAKSDRFVALASNHWDLLSSAEVYAKLRGWLA